MTTAFTGWQERKREVVFAFIVSYATITSGNGDIPKSGSFEMAMRIVNKYKEYGGVLNTNSAVEKIVLNGKMAEGILLQLISRNIYDFGDN